MINERISCLILREDCWRSSFHLKQSEVGEIFLSWSRRKLEVERNGISEKKAAKI